MKPAVPCPAPALHDDSGLTPAMPWTSPEPEEPATPVVPAEVMVPYADFLERRRQRYGIAPERARQDVEGSGE